VTLAEPTVENFAQELGISVTLLLRQLRDAGLCKGVKDNLSGEDKNALLSYLRRKYLRSSSSSSRIILTKRPSASSTTQYTRNASRLAEEIELLNAKRNAYFEMLLEDLVLIYAAGGNEFLDDDEKTILRAVIREKKQIR